MEAWSSADAEEVEAIYAPDVVTVMDGDTMARDRDTLLKIIAQAKGFGNSFTQVGPVLEYLASDGDLYLASVVESANSSTQPRSQPLVGFYRVHDGQVIRHVFMEADAY